MKYIYIVFFLNLIISCEIENIDYLNPIVITDEPQQVFANSVQLGGRVIGEGGRDVTEYGVVWSETFPPTIDDSKKNEGSRIGSFSKVYTDFKSNTTYYYTAYGINEQGVGYGGIYEFKTSAEAPCNPERDNFIDIKTEQLNIDTQRKINSFGFNEGNVGFEISSSSSTARILLTFNQIDEQLPVTGEYTAVNEFENPSLRSKGEYTLKIIDFGIGRNGGGSVKNDEKLYIKKNEGSIEFIFCDVTFKGSDPNILNGQFTYFIK